MIKIKINNKYQTQKRMKHTNKRPNKQNDMNFKSTFKNLSYNNDVAFFLQTVKVSGSN